MNFEIQLQNILIKHMDEKTTLNVVNEIMDLLDECAYSCKDDLLKNVYFQHNDSTIVLDSIKWFAHEWLHKRIQEK